MNFERNRIDRREALKWVAASLALFPTLDWKSVGAPARGARSLTDLDLLKSYKPGELWPRTFTPEELRTVTALCDLIIPADDHSPSAGEVGVPDFLDEWVSAPYPTQQADKIQIRDGLAWLNAESQRRFGKNFTALAKPQQTAIGDNICFAPKAKPGYKAAAEFFAKVRDLTASGFYTTKEGMKDLKYIGNIPLAAFKGPPPEVLAYLKLG